MTSSSPSPVIKYYCAICEYDNTLSQEVKITCQKHLYAGEQKCVLVHNPVLMPCCDNIICENCIRQWINVSHTVTFEEVYRGTKVPKVPQCPYCSKPVLVIVVNGHSVPVQSNIIPVDNDMEDMTAAILRMYYPEHDTMEDSKAYSALDKFTESDEFMQRLIQDGKSQDRKYFRTKFKSLPADDKRYKLAKSLATKAFFAFINESSKKH